MPLMMITGAATDGNNVVFLVFMMKIFIVSVSNVARPVVQFLCVFFKRAHTILTQMSLYPHHTNTPSTTEKELMVTVSGHHRVVDDDYFGVFVCLFGGVFVCVCIGVWGVV